jgi:uncharacterized cupredoxin-like copper-binding protein
MKHMVMIAVAVLGLAASACGGSADATRPAPGTGGGGLTFGEAAMPDEADRTIEVVGLDSMAFEPDALAVAQGEVITFVVTNEGKILHELTLGDEAEQEAHEEEMASGMGNHDHPYSVMLEPGETKEFTWRFTQTGEFLYGCHVPGHYAAGMVGTITVD